MARILAFDDSKMIRGIVCQVLESTSHEIEAICPGSIFEALKHLYQTRPALLITDYNMPNVNGETLIRVIREDENLASLKVIMLSSHHESDLITRIIRHGVDAYVIKGPSMKEELPRRIAEMLK
jgi:CheY-like chemotaxis protein